MHSTSPNRITARLVVGATAALAALLLPSAGGRGLLRCEPPPLSNDDIHELVQAAGSKEDYPDDRALVVLHRADVTVEASGLSHVVERRVVKVLDAQGIAEQSVLRFDYDPATQFLDVRWVKVFKQDGTVVKLSLKGMRDLPQPLSSIFWPTRMKTVEARGLSPGDALAYETYRKGFQIAYLLNPAAGEGGGEGGEGAAGDEEKYVPPMKGHYYDVFLFDEVLPVKEKRYDLHLAQGKPFHWEVYNGAAGAKHTFSDGMSHYAWWKKDMAAVPEEPRQPDRSDFVTKLVLATVTSWEEKSVWFFGVNEPVFAFDEAIVKKVKEITAAAKGDEAKVKELLRWVAHNIRYSGITMGKGEGYTIHPGLMTFNDRCGVCKDIAGMLITMMRAAGYEVYPAMTMAGSRVEDLPADQFNHCVVAWKKKDGSFTMLDPTWAPFDPGTWSLAEGEQDYLVGDADGEDLAQTPPFDPSQNRFVIKGSSAIAADGSLAGKVTLAGSGYADTRMRRALAYQSVKEGPAFYHKLLSSISPFVALSGFAVSDVHDLDAPMTVSTGYAVEGYAAVSKEALRAVVPLARFILKQERWSPYLMLAPWSKRKTPAIFWFPQEVSVEETCKVPPGFEPGKLPDGESFDGKMVSFSFQTTFAKGALAYKASWKVKKRIALEEHFKELDRLAEAIGKREKEELLFVKKPKAAGGAK